MLLSASQQENACQWLLANAGPSIRYRTMVEIMGHDTQHDDVRNCYNEILGSKRFTQISAKQQPNGYFGQKSFHHGSDSGETCLRELFEMGLRPQNEVLNKGLQYAEKLCTQGTEAERWIPGIYLEPLGRAYRSNLVKDWFEAYIRQFELFVENHREDWLETLQGKPTTRFLEIPYIYVIRTIANSWWWLSEYTGADISPILQFLLIDMARVDKLYWISPSKQLYSYPNWFYVFDPIAYCGKPLSVSNLAVMLEGLWLLATFGVIEDYETLMVAFNFVTSKPTADGVWEYPISGVTKTKAKFHSYHGFSIEETWRKSTAPLADLTFRICLIDARNKRGHNGAGSHSTALDEGNA